MQVMGRNSFLCSTGEASSEGLNPALAITIQESLGLVGKSPEENNKMIRGLKKHTLRSSSLFSHVI